MALRNINEITSKNDWVIGHSHISLYGTFTFFAIAGVYYVVPAMTRKPLWSSKLSEWHFNLNLLGSVPIYFSSMDRGILARDALGNLGRWFKLCRISQQPRKPHIFGYCGRNATLLASEILGRDDYCFANLLFVVNIYNTIMLPAEETAKEAKAAL